MENYFLKLALEEARAAFREGEVPVGVVIVKDEKIIAKAHNLREKLHDATAHAEIVAIRKSNELLGKWRLSGCDMYVTLEPCPMCAGAIVQSRIRKLYIGTFDPRAGACGSVMNIVQDVNLNHFVDIEWMYNEECSMLLQEFFKERR